MDNILQFGVIAGFSLAGELLHLLLPLPIPASIYGLVLLLLALKSRAVRLEQVDRAGKFLTGILPILFVPAAVGVMELTGELAEMTLPILAAVLPLTILAMAAAGRTTQSMMRRGTRREK